MCNMLCAAVAVCIQQGKSDLRRAVGVTRRVAVLTGANPEGRGHLENGPALSTATLRRLGCDATVKTLIERDGVVIATGREKPTVSPAMKLKVRNRDGICRAPGCPVPATRCEAHHIDHAFNGGPTELWNLLALCSGRRSRPPRFPVLSSPC
jgi:hypothetical protein